MRNIRFVVVHTPGPQWKAGAPIFEQDGIYDHIGHDSKPLEAGKLAMEGPFLDPAGGGTMIPHSQVTEAESVAFANDDPAVVSGLLRAEVRQWLMGMSR